MRELARREFYLVLICPGLLIAVLYNIIVDGPGRDSLQQMEQSQLVFRRSIAGLDQLITASKNGPFSPIPASRQGTTSLAKQIDAEKGTAGLMSREHWTSGSGKINALHDIASAFQANDLVMLSRQKDITSKKVIPPELENYATAVKNDGNRPVPEVWRIEVIGSYGNLLTALDQLGQSDAFIVPLAVAMEVLPDDATRRNWTLWVWV